MAADEEELDELVDLRQVQYLLEGIVRLDALGVPNEGFVSDPQQQMGRLALVAILLRDEPVPMEIRHLLAGLFAPDGHYLAARRRLDFKARKRGVRKQDIKKASIVAVIRRAKEDGKGVDAGVLEAVDKYKVSREYAYRCWGER